MKFLKLSEYSYIPAESFGMIVVIHESKQRIVYCTVHK
jgi:hypothetical protein